MYKTNFIMQFQEILQQKLYTISENEIAQLERMVSAYLDLAEMQAMRHIPMTMADWEERLNGFLTLWDHEVLKNNGKISAEMAKLHAETEFEKYRIIQDKIYISDFDKLLEDAGIMEDFSTKLVMDNNSNKESRTLNLSRAKRV